DGGCAAQDLLAFGLGDAAGNADHHRLPEALRRAKQGHRVVDTEYAIEEKFEHLPIAESRKIRARGVTAFLTVQEGC
ncbi:hypothetical protein ACC717_38330, partial [Rhizobium ruizarguesonis]